MNIRVLISPRNIHLKQIRNTVQTVNRLQKVFNLELKTESWLPNDRWEKKRIKATRVREQAERKYPEEPLIIVLQNPFTENFFEFSWRTIWAVSVSDWETDFAPPPLEIYLAYQFASAMICLGADLPESLVDSLYHDEPRGCVFDSSGSREEFRIGLIAGQICGECEARLAEMGFSDQSLRAVEQILSYVRDATIRRPRVSPSYIFIGHGRSLQWEKLRDYLVTILGLQIEEFNQEPTAGQSTTHRLEQMLDRACFAILVMTAEDLHGDKRKHARENVIHEIGFFQGRLGFERAIILKEEGAAPFSNIAGLTYIPFRKGKIQESFHEVTRTLLREGIIEPSRMSRAVTAKFRISNHDKLKA